MSKVRRVLGVGFVFVVILGLLTAVFFITTSRPTNAQSHPYPYPEPPCARIDDPVIGPYPAECLYLPEILSETGDEAALAPTIIPSIPLLPISSPANGGIP